MKIYTKTGDAGETGLFAGPRVPKCHARICAYGDVDELNSVLGVARSEGPPAEIDALLTRIQNELFAVGAELATPDPGKQGTRLLGMEHVAALERAIDEFEARLAPLAQFVLPGGTRPAAYLHLARTVCRRAERLAVSLDQESPGAVSPVLLCYLNRLSDLLFVLARAANAAAGQGDVPWIKPPPAPTREG